MHQVVRPCAAPHLWASLPPQADSLCLGSCSRHTARLLPLQSRLNSLALHLLQLRCVISYAQPSITHTPPQSAIHSRLSISQSSAHPDKFLKHKLPRIVQVPLHCRLTRQQSIDGQSSGMGSQKRSSCTSTKSAHSATKCALSWTTTR